MYKNLITTTTVLFLFFIIVVPKVNAENQKTIYMIKEKESLDSLAIKLLPRYKVIYGNRIDDFKKDLRQWNVHIVDWKSIPLFSNIYIEYPYPTYISHPYVPKLTAGTNYNILNSDAETPNGNNRFTIFGVYTISSGNLQQKLTTQEGLVKSTQNSPLSLGIGSTILLDKVNQMISTSVYWSSLTASKLTGEGINSSPIKTKSEIGLNLYYQQLTSLSAISIYGGIDYEKFSNLNTKNFIYQQQLALNQNQLIYGSIGLAKTFFIDDQKILLKTSFSQSIKSSTTSSDPDDKFTGQRFLLFASIKGESRFTYHLIYKHHFLKGPTDLTINRIGLGLGFVLF